MILHRPGAVARSRKDVTRNRSYFSPWLFQLVSSFGDTLHHLALVVGAEIIPGLLPGPVGDCTRSQISSA